MSTEKLRSEVVMPCRVKTKGGDMRGRDPCIVLKTTYYLPFVIYREAHRRLTSYCSKSIYVFEPRKTRQKHTQPTQTHKKKKKSLSEWIGQVFRGKTAVQINK